MVARSEGIRVFENIPHIRFAEPAWLALLAVVPLVIWWGTRSIAGLGKLRSIAALAVRLVVLCGLAAALARAQLVLVRDDMAVAYVVDTSLSIPQAEQQECLNAVTRSQQLVTRQPSDKVALVTFGKNSAIDQPFTADKVDTTTTHAVIEPEYTNIAAAIRTAVAAMPQAGRRRIVLMTDANENEGAALAEAATAKAAGVRIDCLPVRYSYGREVMIEKVVAPPDSAEGRTASINILVRAFNEAKGTLRLFANDELVASEEVTLKPGVNAYTVSRPLSQAGIYDFRATVDSPDDTLYQNNSGTAYSIVRGSKKVLIVEGTADDGATLAKALEDQKVAVEVVSPGALPPGIALVTAYDTIILCNVAAYDLADEQVKTLGAAVRDYGVGLVMVGGENSFGAGGWKGTAVEEALPVEMDVKDRQVVPAGALVIIMHTCEFADGNRWGINIAKAALGTLGRYDEFGILYFGQGGEKWLVPLMQVVDRDKIRAVIDTMNAQDMPDFEPTIKMAEASLTKSEASVKHIVIISDGDPTSPSTAVLTGIASKGITISTVTIRPENSGNIADMKAIAALGKGRAYNPSSASQLPQIFIKEARTVRRGLIFEKPFVPSLVLATVPVTGFAQGDFPQLKGYVITTAKPLAEIPLVTNNDDPLLAHWQNGLGRSAAFTSDAKPKWAADWVAWGQYRQFWGQVVEWVERKVQTGDFTSNCVIRGDTATVSVDAIDRKGDFVDFLDFAGTVLGPDGRSQPVKLEQTGPGHYEGTFKSDEIGTYVPNIHYKDANGNTRTYITALTVPFSPEYKALSTNDVLMKQISDITGGSVIDETADVFRRDFAAEASYSDIWQWALAAAAALFLVDVFLRRVIIDYARALAAARRKLWWLPWIGGARVRAQRAAYTAALLSAKKTAHATRQEAAIKFTPQEGAPVQAIDEIERAQAMARARATAEKSAAAPPPAEVAGQGEQIFTDRLLDAKRRAKKGPGGKGPAQ